MSIASEQDPRPFQGLTHNGDKCKCPATTLVVIGPTFDNFVCTECLVEYDYGVVTKIGAPTIIKARASGMSLAAQSALIDGSARSQAIAWYYKEGTVVKFRNKMFNIYEPE